MLSKNIILFSDESGNVGVMILLLPNITNKIFYLYFDCTFRTYMRTCYYHLVRFRYVAINILVGV